MPFFFAFPIFLVTFANGEYNKTTIFMESIKHLFAQKLLEVKAIKLQPNDPFTWAS